MIQTRVEPNIQIRSLWTNHLLERTESIPKIGKDSYMLTKQFPMFCRQSVLYRVSGGCYYEPRTD